MKRRQFLALAMLAPIAAPARAALRGVAAYCSGPTPPVTPRIPKCIVQLGRVRIDDYAWLKPSNWKQVWRDPSSLSRVLRAHLQDENAYAEAVLAPTLPLQQTLYAEMAARAEGDDGPPPHPEGPWLYYQRFPAGAQHPNWYRRRRAGGGSEELLLDGSQRAGGNPAFRIIHATPSPDQKWFAWAEDATGSERYRICVKDLSTGAILADPIADAYGEFVFAADSAWIFWVYRDANSRPTRVLRRRIGSRVDTLVYREVSPDFLVTVTRTSSGRYIVIRAWNATSSEVRLVSSADPTQAPRVVEPRTPDLVYSVEDWRGRLIILTNADGAANFKLMQVDEARPARRNWRDWVAYDPATYITGMRAFADFFVRSERANAEPRLVVTRTLTGQGIPLTHPDAACDMQICEHQEFAASVLRYVFQSPRQPRQWIAYDITRRASTILKTQAIGGGFHRDDYVVERVFATATDGARVPVTVLRHRDTRLDGSAPLLLYGYGSYGVYVAPDFSADILSLVDRGWIYAIAHVRGGSAMGWTGYLQARQLHKKLTFTDFIACADALVHKGYGAAGRIVMYGFSAGGLLAGAVLNMRPGLFAGVIGEAPFVDMLNTMSDPSHPLVPLTYPDWGNPLASGAIYDYIASYSPYDNVKPQAYPPVLATTSVADDRVGFWEPAKWVAKLRTDDTSHSPKLLRVEMGGHGGGAGRLTQLRQSARFYAFAIWSVTRHCT